MAKTEVILTSNIVGLGAESDQVVVAAGYARNYLFPQRLAIPVSAANKRRLEVLRQRRAEREAHDLNSMTELAASLSRIVLKIAVKTGGDGKMFGAITAGSIADELQRQCDVSLDKKKIHLETPIRTLGEHEIELRLHADVHPKLRVQVESSTPVEIPATAPAEGSKGAAPAAEARAGRPVRERKAGVEAKAPAAKEAKPARARPERGEKRKA
ncbi:MAG TPA: 50S ribosomal protein L9 [Verrucomicrobiota bacterium]|nr:50S ribosomal protein L9 [Verrucomicrobiota bacterium]HRZ39042.1 50S ribosomal protein L9 [Candidatus Paceibacterota bacterium]HRZ57322.1 50S ribosomal protein L9 [Candidatus Paceibacterota bacterium]